MDAHRVKRLVWIASSKKDLLSLPDEVIKSVGFSLHCAQAGLTPSGVKVLKGFQGAGVLEIVEDHDGNTYRAVYTLRFEDTLFVLHCFQKKSKTGVATPKADIELIKSRLNRAKQVYEDMKNGNV
ncbi:MAG: type II toxin-antitoxin system RelE/ParE family toxin [Serratia sp. (in: enterobacteria)]